MPYLLTDKYAGKALNALPMSGQNRVAVFALSVALLLAIPLQFIEVPAAYGVTTLTVGSPALKDRIGKIVQQINADQQVTLSTIVLNGGEVEQPFTVIMDLRDSNGMSVHIAWLDGVVPATNKYEVAVPWDADVVGSYNLRTFILTGPEGSRSFSDVKSSQFEVTRPVILEISGIANFGTRWNGADYTVWFSLLDRSQKETTFDGKAMLSITDELGEKRYVGSVPVARSDFKMFKRSSDTPPVLAYVWKVGWTDVNKGIGEGTARLTFATDDGMSFTAAYGPVGMRQLVGADIERAYDFNYRQYSTTVEKTVIEDNLKITLERIGRFTHPSNGTTGELVTHYRADFTITNLSIDHKTNPSAFMVVDDLSNTYRMVGGVIETGKTLEPHATISGYVLFDEIKEGALWVNMVVVYPEPVEFHVGL